MGRRVALVTGGNQGIGFAITKLLCQQYDGDVILAARNEDRGLKALDKLSQEGLKPIFHLLDIDDVNSIERMRQHIEDTYGGLNVLVNNASVTPLFALEKLNENRANMTEQEILDEELQIARDTTQTNVYGLIRVCDGLFPILRAGARVVHLASRGAKRIIKGAPPRLQQRLTHPLLTVEDVKALMAEYVSSCAAGKLSESGWPNNPYGISKLAAVLLAPIQQRALDQDGSRDIAVNSCCPGMVKTRMTNWRGVTPEEGADTPVYLATLPPGTTIRGQFLGERQPVDLFTFNDQTAKDHSVLNSIAK